MFTIVLFCGCSSLSHRPITFGIYGVRSEDFAELSRAGFDVVQGRPNVAELNLARKEGVKILAPPSGDLSVLSNIDKHRGLWAWYLFDEPDLHAVSPETLIARRRLLRKAGLNRPMALTLSSGGPAREYAAVADRLLVDWYPVPWAPLATFSKEMRLARLGNPTHRPLYAIVQTFDWVLFPEMVKTNMATRPPTGQEVRCMVWTALTHGVDGIFFYALRPRSWDLRTDPTLWGAVTNVIREARQVEPVVRGREIWWDFQMEYLKGEGFNEVWDSAILLRSRNVKKGNHAVEPGLYFIVLNTTGVEQHFRFWSGPGSEESRDLFTDEIVFPINGRLERTYAPYAVHIFGPFPGNSQD